MAYEIIYVCNSINNKNVREGELNILRKYEEELYFEFGENETNIKKRYYNDLDTLNKDYEALLKFKNKVEEPIKEEKEEIKDEKREDYKVADMRKKTNKKRIFY